MKRSRKIVSFFILSVILSGCGDNRSAVNDNADMGTVSAETVEETVELNYGENITNAKLPDKLSEIPQEYFTESDHQGTLVEMEYDTYESCAEKSCRQLQPHGRMLQKAVQGRNSGNFGGMFLNIETENKTYGIQIEPQGIYCITNRDF